MNRPFILVITALLCAIPFTSSAQKESKKARQATANIVASNPSPYLIYTSDGQMTSFDEIIKVALVSDVILFGELHDNPMIHWLQLLLTEAIDVEERELVLGAEMFETDDQLPLNEYLNGVINLSKLEKNTRVWPNFKTDYLPLVDYAKENNHKFIGTFVAMNLWLFSFA